MSKVAADETGFQDKVRSEEYLIFSLGKEFYGIQIAYVTEIIGIQAITEVPELPTYIKGITSLRGKIIPVMDIRCRFNKNLREYDERTCIIVIDIKDISIGLIVDEISEVLLIGEENLVDLPEISSNRYIKGIGKVKDEIKFLLDCNKLVFEDLVEFS